MPELSTSRQDVDLGARIARPRPSLRNLKERRIEILFRLQLDRSQQRVCLRTWRHAVDDKESLVGSDDLRCRYVLLQRPGETLGLRFGIRAPQRKNVARSLDLNSGIEACGLGDAERLGKCGSHKGKPRIERRRRLSWRGNGWGSPYDLPPPHPVARATTLVTAAPPDPALSPL